MKPFITDIYSINHLINLLPKENVVRYFEPFVGSGSMLFEINKIFDNLDNYINDNNFTVINLYKIIGHPLKVYKLIDKLKEFNSDKYRSKEAFDKLVCKFNLKTLECEIEYAAIYIYLNKRCFNGNLRYNKLGFIQPYYSKYLKNSKIFYLQNILQVHDLLNDTKCENSNYIKFLEEFELKSGDFIYFDTRNYYESTFSIDDYNDLKIVCDLINNACAKFMLSLNYNPDIEKLFGFYNITKFSKYSRTANGKVKETEMIVRNYE